LYTLSQQEREGRAPLFAYKRTITLVVYHQVFRFARGFYEFFSTFFNELEVVLAFPAHPGRAACPQAAV
jgi:hypothetical protein